MGVLPVLKIVVDGWMDEGGGGCNAHFKDAKRLIFLARIIPAVVLLESCILRVATQNKESAKRERETYISSTYNSCSGVTWKLYLKGGNTK